MRRKWASIAWELSRSGETWRASIGFSRWGRNIPPLGPHQTGTFPKFQLHTGKSPLSSDRRMKTLPCFLPSLEHFLRKLRMPEPSGCVLRRHQMGQRWIFHAFHSDGCYFQHGPQNPWWTPGTTDVLWSDFFFPTLQMFYGWKFPFKCLRDRGKFPGSCNVHWTLTATLWALVWTLRWVIPGFFNQNIPLCCFCCFSGSLCLQGFVASIH